MILVDCLWFIVKVIFFLCLIGLGFNCFIDLVIMQPIHNSKIRKQELENARVINEKLKNINFENLLGNFILNTLIEQEKNKNN